jgi:hypothetical protein
MAAYDSAPKFCRCALRANFSLWNQVFKNKMEISSSIVSMQPGMYILRHPKGNAVPISVCRAPGAITAQNCGKMEFLSTPKTQGSVLRDGADCIVVLISDAPVELLVSAVVKNKEVASALRIDQIALDAEETVAPAPENGKFVIAPNGISIIGHLEKKGDVLANVGQILGDPVSGSRIEGFQVMWPDRPEGVDLAYGIAVEGVGAMPMTKSGNFCGTRGEARRITEVTFALVGPDANKYQLEGAAHFSGGFALPVASGMPLGGPSGVEHLTALSLKAMPRIAGEKSNPWDESPRTRVFKSKAVAGATKKADTRAAKVK